MKYVDFMCIQTATLFFTTLGVDFRKIVSITNFAIILIFYEKIISSKHKEQSEIFGRPQIKLQQIIVSISKTNTVYHYTMYRFISYESN